MRVTLRGGQGRLARTAVAVAGTALLAAYTPGVAASAAPVRAAAPPPQSRGGVGSPAPAAPGVASADPASAHYSLASEAARARARLAVTSRQAHPGRPETMVDPAAVGLGDGYLGEVGLGARGALGPPRRAAPAAPAVVRRGGTVGLSGPSAVLGIDVANYQGDVDWSQVGAAGGSFAYVKATQGTSYVDSQYFYEQYEGSYDAGLVRGAYHFAIPDDSTGAAQADYFVANGGGWSADGHTLPGMLDIENNPYGPECYGLTQSQMVAWVASFDNEYKALTGRYPALYTNAYWWDTCTGGSSVASVDPLVIANWPSPTPGAGSQPSPLPGGWSTWTVWQYTDATPLGTDGDAFNGTPAGLTDFALGAGATDELTAGQVLEAGQSMSSTSGTYQVSMLADGNLVETLDGGRTLWASGTAGNPGATAVMGADGQLSVVSASGGTLWSTPTAGDGDSEAVIQDDGNFVIYTVAGYHPTWYTGTYNNYDELRAGQVLEAGQSMSSTSGTYQVSMLADGNLVETLDGGRTLWASGTAGNPGATAVMGADGQLSVVSASGGTLWSTPTAGDGDSEAVIQDDGNFVIYTVAGYHPTWYTGTYNNYDELRVDQSLQSGQCVESDSDLYEVCMLTDGDLVEQVVASGASLWSSGTAGNPGAYVTMRADGNLTVFSPGGAVLWKTATGMDGLSFAIVQDDRNFVVYAVAGHRPTWYTSTEV